MVKDLGLRLWGENVVVLVVSSADKQRQRFTQVQAPQVEVKTLLPACLVLIVWIMRLRRSSGEVSISLELFWWFEYGLVLDRHPSQPLNRLGLGSL